MEPIWDSPLYLDFYDQLRRLTRRGILVPDADVSDLRGFSVNEQGEAVYHPLRVYYLFDLVNYVPVPRRTIELEEGREVIRLTEAEYEIWGRIAEGLLCEYLELQLTDGGFTNCGDGKMQEFKSLLPVLLGSFSPAQITSSIWSAMATAEKKAKDGPWYQREGSYAVGIVVNRLKSALNEGWKPKPNIPTLDVPQTFFEEYFFNVHIPIGETWVYRSIPRIIDGTVELPLPIYPKGRDSATSEMISFASAIASELDLPEPDYLSYAATADFISSYKVTFIERQGG